MRRHSLVPSVLRLVVIAALAIGPTARSSTADEVVADSELAPVIPASVHRFAKPVVEDCADGFCGESACATCCDACGSHMWVRAEGLLWWVKGNRVPPLVTTSPVNTPRPDAGILPGAAIEYGDGLVDQNVRPGARLTAGFWLDACRDWALEGYGFYLDDGDNDGYYTNLSNGLPILARPFYNSVLDEPDSQLVAYPGVVAGGLEILTSSDLYSGGLSLRRRFLTTCNHRFDLLGGYRYFRYREGLMVREGLQITETGGLIPQGTQILLFDNFETENDFHGGEIGITSTWTHGCWQLDSVAKVALGNVHQLLRIEGGTLTTVPGLTPFPAVGGLLALGSNIGEYERDVFGFLPELNLNLRYKLSPCCSVLAGYSLLFVSDVFRTGDQVDVRVDTTQLPTASDSVATTLPPGTYPIALQRDTALWAQGLNVGLELNW